VCSSDLGPHFSVQLNSAGIDCLRDDLVTVLKELFAPESILWRNDSAMRPLENLPTEVTTAWGSVPESVTVVENGITMSVPLISGQKTGWFYDHRNNRARLRAYVKERTVLDVFSYVGSFAVQAATFGASHVTAVDASSAALIMAKQNAQQNGVSEIFETILGDAFEVLKKLYNDGARFDVIIVDPPAFIKRKKDHREGLKAYHRINELAIRLLNPDAFLLSASCSMHLHRDELLQVLRTSGRKQGRHLQILEDGTQGPDHPVHPAIPETLYLKAFIARVCDE
jgi:23S rRNA (cytosine1962-C5)-methyltransferase